MNGEIKEARCMECGVHDDVQWMVAGSCRWCFEKWKKAKAEGK